MIDIQQGFERAEAETVAKLFWEAFSGKLGMLLGPAPQAVGFLQRVIQPEFAFAARSPSGELLGIAGFKTGTGGLVGGTLRDMIAVYGPWGGLWRGLLLDQLERDLQPEQLLMDGIFVASHGRNQGVGTALLQVIIEYARRQGYREIRLDVIDHNTRAKALYERQGFEEKGERCTGLLSGVFGFKRATTMCLVLTTSAPAVEGTRHAPQQHKRS